MNPFTLHQSAMIRQIFDELGRHNEAEERVHRWYRLRDSFSVSGDTPEQRVREVKQYARSRIYSEVLDGIPEAVRLFEQKEAEGFSLDEGIREILERLKRAGAVLAIVSESASRPAASAISRFMAVHRVHEYFSELVTPAGRFDAAGELVGEEFFGKTKRDGTIYDELVKHLRARRFDERRAAIVGDDPVLDIQNAKARGFMTVQYTGIVNRGASALADHVIDDWSKFPATD